jgi:hypothetical protein
MDNGDELLLKGNPNLNAQSAFLRRAVGIVFGLLKKGGIGRKGIQHQVKMCQY